MKRFEIFFGIIKIPVDFFMTAIAFLVSYKLRLITSPDTIFAKPIDYTTFPTLPEYMIFSLWASAALVAVFALGKMYNLRSTVSFSRETGRVLILGLVWIMVIITYFFFARTLPFSRLAFVYSWGLSFVFVLLGRAMIKIIQQILLSLNVGKRRVILIGKNNLTKDISKALSKNRSYQIVSSIDQLSLKRLEYLIEKNRVDEIIQTETNLSKSLSEELIEFCDLNHINYRFIPDMLDVRRTNLDVDTINQIPIISLKSTPLDGWGRVTKRFADLFGSIILLIILSPILLLTAIAIKLDSKGPILFCKLDDGQPAKRIGQYGTPFKFYKFRSMHPNTHNQRYKELAHHNTRTDGPLMKIKNDPRVTRVGRFIRKYSIDELPQLWNVLIGNLSLVGPRPHLPEEVSKYQRHHKFVLTIKPGITGLAQISGRSDIDFEQEVKLDRYYIENWSLLLDLKIMLRTVWVVLKGHQE